MARLASDSSPATHPDEHRILIREVREASSSHDEDHSSLEQRDATSHAVSAAPTGATQGETQYSAVDSEIDSKQEPTLSTESIQHGQRRWQLIQTSLAKTTRFILCHPWTFIIPSLALGASLALSILACQYDWLAYKPTLQGVLIGLSFLITLLILTIMVSGPPAPSLPPSLPLSELILITNDSRFSISNYRSRNKTCLRKRRSETLLS